jgi:hypothetical protein
MIDYIRLFVCGAQFYLLARWNSLSEEGRILTVYVCTGKIPFRTLIPVYSLKL